MRFSFFILLFFCLLNTSSLFAQTSVPSVPKIGKVSGQVIDKSTSAPVEYANVVVLSKKDSSLVNGGITDEKGTFSFSNLVPGHFFIKVSFIGYKDFVSSEFQLTNSNSEKNFGKIGLETSATFLEGVNITAERSMMEYKLDKRVINVDKNLVTSGGTASDVLENVPSVTLDQDGNVSLRGNTSVKILIDGRPSELYGSDIVSVLAQIPASEIENVEIITNPSAKYNPDGMSGIINITLKKKISNGFNGSVSLTAGTALPKFLPTTGLSLNLNYHTQKYSLFTTIDGRLDERGRKGTNSQQTAYSIEDQKSSNTNKSWTGSAKIGGEYYFTPKATLALSYQYTRRSSEWTQNILSTKSTLSDSIFDIYEKDNNENSDRTSHNITMNFLKKFKKKGQELSLDAAYGSNSEHEDNNNVQSFDQRFNPSPSITQLSKQPTINQNFSSTLNYTHPFNDKLNLEIGMQTNMNWRNDSNTLMVWNPLYNDGFLIDTNGTNYFLYNDKTYALYATLGWQVTSKFSVLAGLRGELAQWDLQQKNSNGENYNQSYNSLYPSLHFSYKFNDRQSMQLSYSRRINRPNMWNLNPFKDYSNPNEIRFGNPNLEPEFTNSLEIGYNHSIKKTNIFTSLYYRQTNNSINRFSFLWNEQNAEMYGFEWDGDTSNSRIARTSMNFSTSQSYGAEIIIDQQITKWWKINLSINLYQSVLNADEQTKSGFTGNAKFNSNMNFAHDISLQISGQYRAPSVTFQGKMYDSFWIDIAAKKDIWKKKGNISIRLSDALGTGRFKFYSEGTGFSSTSESYRYAPVLVLGFTYKINEDSAKAKQRKKPQTYDSQSNSDDMEM